MMPTLAGESPTILHPGPRVPHNVPDCRRSFPRSPMRMESFLWTVLSHLPLTQALSLSDFFFFHHYTLCSFREDLCLILSTLNAWHPIGAQYILVE